jgi:histone demethylase JARID1
MSGINVPWVYVGMKYSTFCWHFEDLMLPSINYSHYGKPKLWYGIPESNRERFDKAVKEKCSLLFKEDPNILFDVVTMVSPAYLLSKSVKVYKTLQRPGEFIVTYPGSYHAGFSTGLNIGEAVNFATKTWFEYGRKCQDIYRRSRERIPVFPIEWVLTQNILNLDKVNLDQESLIKVRDYYSDMVAEELKSRAAMEAIIKKHF